MSSRDELNMSRQEENYLYFPVLLLIVSAFMLGSGIASFASENFRYDCSNDLSRTPLRDASSQSSSLLTSYLVDVTPTLDGDLFVRLFLSYVVTEGTKSFGFKQFYPPIPKHSYVTNVSAHDQEGHQLNTQVTCDGDFVEVGWWFHDPVPQDESVNVTVTFLFTKAIIDTGTTNIISLPNAGYFKIPVQNATYIVHLPSNVRIIPGADASDFTEQNGTFVASLLKRADPPRLEVTKFVDGSRFLQKKVTFISIWESFNYLRHGLFAVIDLMLTIVAIILVITKKNHVKDMQLHEILELPPDELEKIPLSAYVTMLHGTKAAFWATLYSLKLHESQVKKSRAKGRKRTKKRKTVKKLLNREPWPHEKILMATEPKDLKSALPSFKLQLATDLERHGFKTASIKGKLQVVGIIALILGVLTAFQAEYGMALTLRMVALVLISIPTVHACSPGKIVSKRFKGSLTKKLEHGFVDASITEYLPLLGYDSANKIQALLEKDQALAATLHEEMTRAVTAMKKVESVISELINKSVAKKGILNAFFKTSRSSSTGCSGCSGCSGCGGCGGCGG